MLRITKLTDYAVILVQHMLHEPLRCWQAKDLAVQTGLQEPTVKKLLKKLSAAQWLRSIRGVQGGYILLKHSDEMNLANLLQVIEGAVALTPCLTSHLGCERESHCQSKLPWHRVNNRLLAVLQAISLTEFVQASPEAKFSWTGESQ